MSREGEVFGRYELLQRIAVGGMAEIFLGRSSGIDGFEKTLVIKKIRPDLSADTQFSSLFIDEARISITLSHPNIIQVFDFGQADGSYYLAMEHVHGCDLASILQVDGIRNLGIEPGLALLIAEEMCKGLDYAHEQTDRDGTPLHIIHRDVSPANVMLAFHGAVKIADFGIAQSDKRTAQTKPGMVLGKLAYMSPQHATDKPIDARADVFSTGLVLWEMLVGAPAYRVGVPSGVEFFDAVVRASIRPPSTVHPHLGTAFDDLVMGALTKDPNGRYSSARMFAEAIHHTLVSHYPEISSYTLQTFLQQHAHELLTINKHRTKTNDLDPFVRSEAVEPPPPTHSTNIVTAELKSLNADDSNFDWSPEFVKAASNFAHNPSLWTLVRMSRICDRAQQYEAASTLARVAAIKFAQAGQLAQSLLCMRTALERRSFDALKNDVQALPALVGRSNEDIDSRLFPVGKNSNINTLLHNLLADTIPTKNREMASTPLLSYMGAEAFAELARQAPLLRFSEKQTVLKEGAPGESMYLIAEGRVLVYATTAEGRRIYLSSLTAGDFIGENSFFTGAPRSASIEALYDVAVFEIDRELYGRVTFGNPQASAIMLRFYKERIVDTVIAKSSIFGLLRSQDRRALIDRFELRIFQPGQLIIEEGTTSANIYLIKSGHATVYTDKGGPRTTLSTLGPGSLFGEVAALRKVPRTASVVADERLEALELSGRDFAHILNARPQIREQILNIVSERTRENMDKLMGPSPFAAR